MTKPASKPWAARLALALARHGPQKVTRFGLDLIRRRGLGGALAYARYRGRPPETKTPYRLDTDGSISESLWRAWSSQVRAARLAQPGALSDRPAIQALAFVVDTTDGGDADATQASIRAHVPTARICASLDAIGRAGAATPDWVVFLKAGDLLTEDFPSDFGAGLEGVEVLTFDLVRHEAGRVFPIFLPGANPTLAHSAPAFYARFALSGRALHQAGDTAETFLALWLQAHSGRAARRLWRHEGGLPWVRIAGQLSAPVDRASPPATPHAARRCVSVVICTKDKGHLTRQLVRGLLSTQAEVLDVAIVSNATTRPHALAALRDLASDPRVTVLHEDGPFNFSQLANIGAEATAGDLLLFLNDDIVPVTEDWLARLVAALDQPDVGVVGPLLIYPNETIQHAGVYLGYRGVAGHMLRHTRQGEDDYLGLAALARETTAVTGAALLTRRATFGALGGFDLRLATFLQDVDYCLRVRAGGLACVFDPRAVLIHMESASIHDLPQDDLNTQRPRELMQFQARWGGRLAVDRFFPSGLSPEHEDLTALRPMHAWMTLQS
jgi:GT2 family glycosyltransferase